MRVTFCAGPAAPGVDLELAVGVTVGALRGPLAAVSGCRDALAGELAVGGVVLDDTHLTGTFPLVTGARLSVGRCASADDGVLAAVRARRHLAVLAGPDAGLLWPVGERLGVGRGGVVAAADGALDAGVLGLADSRVSHHHLALREALGRVWVRDVGSVNGSRRSRRWARHRVAIPVPRWWSRCRDGDRVMVGETVLELRSAAAPPSRSGQRSLAAVTAIAPALGSLALVAGTGNPALLALGLAGPALVPLVGRAAAARGANRDRGAGSAGAGPGRAADDAHDDAGGGLPGASGEPASAVSAVDLAADAVRAVLSGRPAPARGTFDRLAPVGALAVCGPGARDLAATLVLAANPATVEVHGAGAEHWGWTRWFDSAVAGTVGTAGPSVVVVDGAEPRPEWGGPGRVVVLVAPDRVPSWCTARLDAATGVWSGPEGERLEPVEAGGAAWASRQARLLAGARFLHAAGEGGLPDSVTLGALDVPSDTGAVTARWLEADGNLLAVLGAGPGGRCLGVDLVREGPHALVAGTTGSGKSEALRALVASLALRYPPTALAFALVDFKGGAGFGALTALPHVVGTVTDLDAHEAARAIGGLAAELRSRKALLARVGVTDLRDWPAGAEVPHPGRLVVVVDEFRALAEELPDLMGALVRVATQGRSLGVHLVLATQRPSGVVSSELRANVALRLALRVTDAGDSSDVIDVADAAAISPAQPGRALLRRGPGPVEDVQIALVGAGQPPVRFADDDAAGVERGPRGGEDEPLEPDAELVAAVTTAAARWRPGAPRPSAPWLPALPAEVTLDDLGAGPDGAEGLPFGLADVPDAQSRTVARWNPLEGHLLATGGPASGRSTFLETIGVAALARGWSVHAVGLPPGTFGPQHPPGLGTVCGLDDPRRLARLVTRLLDAPPRTILLVDDVGAASRALEAVARGDGASRFVELFRERPVAVAATADNAVGPWPALATQRIVLPLPDDAAEALAGVPREMCGARRGPGRAVWLPPRAEPLVCQIARAGPVTVDAGHARPSPAAPVRLLPVPLEARRPRIARSRRPRLAVGIGGDAARVVGLDPALGGLVVGPPGSGRSTAVAHLVLSARALGLDPLVIARDGPVRAAGGDSPRVRGFDRDALLEALSEPQDAVVVDDLDALARLAPDVTDVLDDAAEEGLVLFASMTTTAALSAYRGAVTALRARRHGVVLGAHTPGSDEVLGSPLAWDLDPTRPAHPGRGVIQLGAQLQPVQVFAPPS